MNERKQNEILEKIDLLNTVHLRLLSEIKRRNDLLDKLIQDQDRSDWWKEGPDTEC